jgi:phosphoserine phosphatase
MDARSERIAVPLAVDLDGTLIATDLLWESLFLLIRKNPLCLFLLPFWLWRGRAYLKCAIAERVELDPVALPYREDLLERLREDHGAGRRIVLATAAPRRLAEKIAAHLGLFDLVISTDPARNMAAVKSGTNAGSSSLATGARGPASTWRTRKLGSTTTTGCWPPAWDSEGCTACAGSTLWTDVEGSCG